MATERKFGLLTTGAEKNFVVAAHIIEKIQAVKEKAGLAQTGDIVAAQRVESLSGPTDWSRVYGRESVTKVMNNPESRMRVVRTVESMIDLFANKMSPQDLERARDKKRPAEPSVEDKA